ncbi:MAG: hypothetical protein ACE5H1_05720 [Thermodesulfobacteriota bacterium]
MKHLEIDYSTNKEMLNEVWETILERDYLLDTLIGAFFTTFTEFRNNNIVKSQISSSKSFKELYYYLNGINMLEEFVATFDEGIWDSRDTKNL